jgi:S-adenosylmethionine/arginine decarboxylase-like enzyme
MNVGGFHLLVDIKGSERIAPMLKPEEFLPDVYVWMGKIKARILKVEVVPFKGENSGYTMFICLAESHFSVHFYPESGGVSLDIFTCGSVNPFILENDILEYFGGESKVRKIKREI